MVLKHVLNSMIVMLIMLCIMMWMQLSKEIQQKDWTIAQLEDKLHKCNAHCGWRKDKSELYAFNQGDDGRASFSGEQLTWDEYVCVSRLNVDVQKRVFNGEIPSEKCVKSNYLPGALIRGFDEFNTKYFCVPQLTKFVLVKAATKCGVEGHCINSPYGQIKQFAPVKSESDLETMMADSAIGLEKSAIIRNFGECHSQTVFFSDECSLVGDELTCGVENYDLSKYC